VAELAVEVQGAGHSVIEELYLDRKPRCTGKPPRSITVGEVSGDGVVKLGADDAIHPCPI